MLQSPSWESNWFSTSQGIPGILRKPRLPCPNPEPDQQSLPLHPTSWRYSLILSSHLRLHIWRISTNILNTQSPTADGGGCPPPWGLVEVLTPYCKNGRYYGTFHRALDLFPTRTRTLSSPKRPDWLWGRPILQSKEYRGLFRRGRAAGAWRWLTST